MFNLNKDNIKSKSDQLEENAKELITETSDKVKEKTGLVANQVVEKTESAKNEANTLVSSIKKLVNEYADANKISEYQTQLSEKAIELKDKMKHEAVHAYKVGKLTTKKSIKEHPIATVALVAGAGLMLGYIIGTKKSSK
jgi:ElaB/YqjD/DUF883 family membrane-anchored ribosome-binding protein